MLTKKTVFILGAGASKPFGFPTGIELSELVVKQLRVGQNSYNHLHQLGGFSPDAIRAFRETFYFSGKNSVDAFLEHRTEFIDIGKAATASVLITYESEESLFKYTGENWLRYLYNNLNTSFDDFGKNQLSIVTFNYDRAVEHFLFTSLKNSYGKTDDECITALKNIPIIHLHGRLGALPWQDPRGRLYNSMLDKSTIQACVDNIKIIHEDISDGRDRDFERAKELLAESEQTFFLGFGFNRTNLERLNIRELPRTAMATAVGVGNQESQAIKKMCEGKISLIGADCIHIMRECVSWG